MSKRDLSKNRSEDRDWKFYNRKGLGAWTTTTSARGGSLVPAPRPEPQIIYSSRGSGASRGRGARVASSSTPTTAIAQRKDPRAPSPVRARSPLRAVSAAARPTVDPLQGTAADERDRKASAEAHKIWPSGTALSDLAKRLPTIFEMVSALIKEEGHSFTKQVLTHLPLSVVRGFALFSKHRINPLPEDLFEGDVINSCLFRDLSRRKRALVSAAAGLSNDTASASDLSGHLLTSMFVKKTGFASNMFRMEPLDSDEKTHPVLHYDPRSDWVLRTLRNYGSSSVVPSLELFKMNLEAFSKGMLKHVDWNGVVLAGGAVLACAMPLPRHILRTYRAAKRVSRLVKRLPLPADIRGMIESYVAGDRAVREDHSKSYQNPLAELQADLHQYWHSSRDNPFATSDLDLFIVAKTEEEAEKKLAQLLTQITVAIPRAYQLVRTHNSVTIVTGYPYRNVQLLITCLRDTEELIQFCDLDCTAMVYNGTNVVASARAVRALNKRANMVTPAMVRRLGSTTTRMRKYAARGFSAVCFELCKHSPRCDVAVDADLRNAFTPPRFFNRVRDSGRAVYPELTVPYNRDMRLNDIIARVSRSSMAVVGASLDELKIRQSVPIQKRLPDPSPERERRAPDPAFTSSGTTPMDLDERKKAEEAEAIRKAEEEAEEAERKKRREEALAATPQQYLKPLRWKLSDILASRDTDDFLPRCYMCNTRWHPETIEQVGLGICPTCAALNLSKWTQWDSLRVEGRVALVTGARIKIGYQCALRLLRSGFEVIATTRFPREAAARYAAEPDSASWMSRLRLYGLDMRHLPSISKFIEFMLRNYKRLDVLVNNAAQTIRRPRAYYHALVQREAALAGDPTVARLVHQDTPKASASLIEGAGASENSQLLVPTMGSHALIKLPPHLTDIALSAALTQLPVLAADAATRDDALFPPHKRDEQSGDPKDLREETSWTAETDDISPLELLEVQLINVTAPFMLLQQLTPLMSACGAVGSHVVNVTSTEGAFLNNKNPQHVHTNMAKASLNMMTHTVGTSFARTRRMFVNAVDTGWVTNMKPVSRAQSSTAPLSDRDGAARVLDPVYAGLTCAADDIGSLPSGVLFRNFKVTPWASSNENNNANTTNTNPTKM